MSLLLMMFLQQGAGVAVAPGMTATPPSERAFDTCMRPLATDRATASSRITITCAVVRNGAPDQCRLETGQDNPVRHRTAARCLAREYRFTDSATGQPANGGPVTMPISLNVQIRDAF